MYSLKEFAYLFFLYHSKEDFQKIEQIDKNNFKITQARHFIFNVRTIDCNIINDDLNDVLFTYSSFDDGSNIYSICFKFENEYYSLELNLKEISESTLFKRTRSENPDSLRIFSNYLYSLSSLKFDIEKLYDHVIELINTLFNSKSERLKLILNK